MADILIRGMEMPKNCWECACSDMGVVPNRAICRIAGFGIWFNDRRRNKDCPLIALPEGHGRLVDADKLMRHYAWWGECEQRELFDSIIEQQNTIVPAEREDV